MNLKVPNCDTRAYLCTSLTEKDMQSCVHSCEVDVDMQDIRIHAHLYQCVYM